MIRRVGLGYGFAVVAAAALGVGLMAWTPSFVSAASSGAAALQAAAQAGQSSMETMKTSAKLVVVNVVVTDKDHNPVHGLKAADFTVRENGKVQTIKNFEEHTAATAADATKFAPMPKLPPDVFTNYTPTPVNGAVNLILLDALNTPMAAQSYVREQLLAYLKTVPPGTRIAIFGLNSRLFLLQGFTSDPAVLRTAMEKEMAMASPLMDDRTGVGGVQQSTTDSLEDLEADQDGVVNGALVANLSQFDAVQQSSEEQMRVKTTMAAMSQISRYVANIPGRKNLIWFSGSFPISVLPDTTVASPASVPDTTGAPQGGASTKGKAPAPITSDPFAPVASSNDEVSATLTLLEQSQIAVYPIDARGMMTLPTDSASTTRNYGGKTGNTRISQDEQKFTSDTEAENSTMKTMADATGGRAFVNTNGLTEAVETAIENGSNFYTLSYTPTNDKLDGKQRKIKVETKQPGVTLVYRKAYFADKPGAEVAASEQMNTLQLAMMRGAPVPTEVMLGVGVVPITPAGQTEDKVAVGNQVEPTTHGPYRRYGVSFSIQPEDLVFTPKPDGKTHADFQLMIFAYNADGVLVNSESGAVHIAEAADELKQKLAHGLAFRLEISTPAKGEYFLRIGVHDLSDDHYGAVEVATSDVKYIATPATPGARAGAGK